MNDFIELDCESVNCSVMSEGLTGIEMVKYCEDNKITVNHPAKEIFLNREDQIAIPIGIKCEIGILKGVAISKTEHRTISSVLEYQGRENSDLTLGYLFYFVKQYKDKMDDAGFNRIVFVKQRLSNSDLVFWYGDKKGVACLCVSVFPRLQTWQDRDGFGFKIFPSAS